MTNRISTAIFCLFALTNAFAQPAPIVVEHGTYVVRLLLHPIGREEYTLTRTISGDLTLTSTSISSDRGTTRSITSTLDLSPLLNPVRLQQSTVPANPDGPSLVQIAGSTATIREGSQSRSTPTPPIFFPGFSPMPVPLQMVMMRYWKLHHQPALLPVLRVSSRALPVEIKLVGHDAFFAHGRMERFARYTIANLVFGREILWMNDSNRVAAVMTFAGGLPQEIVLDEDAGLMGELYHSGVRQEMLDLADLTHQVPPAAQGTFAITGARLIDATGAPR